MASLDVIRTLTIRAKAEGVDAARSAVTGLGEAYESSAQRQLSMDRALANLERRFITGARETQEFERVQRQANLIVAQFPALQDRVNRVLDEAGAKLAPLSGGLDRVAAGMSQAGSASQRMIAGMSNFGREIVAVNDNTLRYNRSNQLARFELVNLGRQIQDVGVSLASGQSLMSVLIQQGSQIADVFISAGVSMKAFAQQVLGWLSPGALLLASFAAISAAAGAFFLLVRRQGPSVDDILKAQAETLGVLREAYKGTADAAGQFLTQSKLITQLELENQFRQITGQLEKMTTELEKATTTPMSVPSEIPLPLGTQAIQDAKIAASGFREINDAINNLNASARGATDIKDFRDRLAEIALSAKDTNAPLAAAAEELLKSSAEAGKAADAWLRGAAALRVLAGAASEADRTLLGLSSAFDSFTASTEDRIKRLQLETTLVGKSAGEQERLRIQFDAERAARRALTPEEQGRVDRLKQEAGAAADAKQAAEDRLKADQRAHKESLSALDVMRNNVSALGDAATAAEKYELQVAELAAKLQEGTINQDTFNRAVAALNPTTKALQNAVTDVGEALAKAFVEGTSGAEALNRALRSVASTATSSAISGLVKGISGQGFDFTTIATQGLIGGAALLLSRLFGGEDDKAAQELQKRAEEAKKQLDGMVSSLTDAAAAFRDVTDAAGGELIDALKNARRQLEEIERQAIAVQEFAATEGGVSVASNIANLAVQQATAQLQAAQQAFAEFQNRQIEQFREKLRGKDELSPFLQRLADINDGARQVSVALQEAGASAEVAAVAVGQDLSVALRRLKEDFVDGLIRELNEAQGRGFINEFRDLIREIADARNTAAQLGGIDDLTLIDAVFNAKAQAIVNAAKLTGFAFDELLIMFPELTGRVQQFTEATTEASQAVSDAAAALEEAANRAKSLQDRLLAATVDATTLEGKLAIFERAAQREREEEAKLGGQNMTLLEQVLAAERLQIINDFNKQAIEAEKQAAEQRLNQINAVAKSITAFVSGLFAGPQSTLSPMAQLTQAQATYQAVLSLAQAGDIGAQQEITSVASTLVDALRAVFGSSAPFQQGIQQIASQLLNLPAVVETTDPVVAAIQQSIAVLQGISISTGSTASSTAQTVNSVDTVASEQSLTNSLLGQVTHGVFLTAEQITFDQINTNAIINAITQVYFNINTTNNLLNALITAEYSATPGQTGGLVTGGISGKDSVRILAMPGEFLVNARSASRHRGLLTAINDNSMGASDFGGTLVAEIRALRSDLARGFVANAEHVRDGIDGLSRDVNNMSRENALRGQAA